MKYPAVSNYLNGSFVVDDLPALDVYNPSEGSVISRVPLSSHREVDRAHREWTPAQIGFLANLVRLYRGEALDFALGGEEARAKFEEVFGKSPQFADVPGLCRATTLKEIEAQGWSLNPGRHVGVAAGEVVSDEDFKAQLETLNEELETLNARARDLEQIVAGNVAEILEA